METTNEVNKTEAVHLPPKLAIEQGVLVPIRDIFVPEDTRPHSEDDIESRAVSMEREGQLENALLSREDGKLILVFGKGRLLSAQKRNWECLRCDIREGMTQSQKLLAQLAENNEREAASPFYTAQLYNRIMEVEHLSPEQLPDYLKKSRALVYMYLSLGKLPAEVKSMSNRLDIGLCHWLEIAKLPNPEQQVQLAQECAEKDYSVRELQARVRKLLNPAKAGEAPQKAQPWTSEAPHPFQITRKGSRFSFTGEAVTVEDLDLYVQRFRCAVIDFLSQEKEVQAAKAAPADAVAA